MEPYKFSCDFCLFNANNKKHFDKHCSTQKHIKNIQSNKKMEKSFECANCNKSYVTQSGLWRHTSKCKKVEIVTEEMKQEMREIKNIVSNITPSTTNIQHNNNNTNAFNVNVYLNENMTNAHNLIDIMSKIMIDNTYRDKVQKNGYVNTICGLVTDKIEEVPIDQRPIYCIKNEDDNQDIVHVRHDNRWKKETELEWTSNIYKYYNGDDEDDEAEKNIIFKSLKHMEDSVMEQIKDLYRNSVRFKIIERETESEMNFIANKIKIIRCLLEHIKLDKKELLQLIEDTYKTQTVENIITNPNPNPINSCI